jgi:predicted  nucleic acid-binding Zn-ribbon protein
MPELIIPGRKATKPPEPKKEPTFDDTLIYNSVQQLEDIQSRVTDLLSVIEGVRSDILNVKDDLHYSDLEQTKHKEEFDSINECLDELDASLEPISGQLNSHGQRVYERHEALRKVLEEKDTHAA